MPDFVDIYFIVHKGMKSVDDDFDPGYAPVLGMVLQDFSVLVGLVRLGRDPLPLTRTS